MALDTLFKKKIRILNFDDSILSQKNLIRKFATPPYNIEIIDLKSEASRIRYWTNNAALEQLRRKIGIDSRNVVTLYGSGDFHHISAILIEQFKDPLSVIVFDYHPDWDALSPRLNCGSWANFLLKKENIRKIVLLGPSSNDLSSKGLFSASFQGLKNKKIEIYPYLRKPSRVFLRDLKGIDCFGVKHGFFSSVIKWNNLAEKDINTFLPVLLDKIPTTDVYISIDKDCLTQDYALTNWEEGLLKLEWLLGALNIIKNRKNIIGLDITGDYSPIVINNKLKMFISCLDHPKEAAKLRNTEKISLLNETANLKVLELFV